MPEITIAVPRGHFGLGEVETYLRGELREVIVYLDSGKRYKLSFLSANRLRDMFAQLCAAGQTFFAEPGLITLHEVTNEAMTEAIHKLWRERYFDRLKAEE
jgi:hypothetical protein